MRLRSTRPCGHADPYAKDALLLPRRSWTPVQADRATCGERSDDVRGGKKEKIREESAHGREMVVVNGRLVRDRSDVKRAQS
jgi:hypothetical protein